MDNKDLDEILDDIENNALSSTVSKSTKTEFWGKVLATVIISVYLLWQFGIINTLINGVPKIGSIVEANKYHAVYKGVASSSVTNYIEMEAGIAFYSFYYKEQKRRVYVFDSLTIWSEGELNEKTYTANEEYKNTIIPFEPSLIIDENGIEWKIQLEK